MTSRSEKPKRVQCPGDPIEVMQFHQCFATGRFSWRRSPDEDAYECANCGTVFVGGPIVEQPA